MRLILKDIPDYIKLPSPRGVKLKSKSAAEKVESYKLPSPYGEKLKLLQRCNRRQQQRVTVPLRGEVEIEDASVDYTQIHNVTVPLRGEVEIWHRRPCHYGRDVTVPLRGEVEMAKPCKTEPRFSPVSAQILRSQGYYNTLCRKIKDIFPKRSA